MSRMPSSFYIHTFGCQMNQADSEIVTALLRAEGFVPSADETNADIVLLNSCAVRENAEERLGNILMHLKGRKRRCKELVIGVLGCVPQFERERVFSDYPFVDFIVGPDNYRELAGLVAGLREAVARPALLDYDQTETYAGIEPVRAGSCR